MAARQHLSRYQQGIVKRYYEHQDTILTNRLSELVSELYLAEGAAQATRLWSRARQALAKAGVEPRRIEPIVEARDVTALARLVNELAGGRK